MKQRPPIVLTVSFLLALVACRPNGQSQSNGKGWDRLPEVIGTHDSTVIFVWSSWCQASKLTFMENVVPYLNDPKEDIGFVLVHFGKKNEIPEAVLERNIVINQSSYRGLDKIVANARFKALLKDYHYQNNMPMTVLVDRQCHVLNYDPALDKYLSFGEVLWQIRNP